MKNISASKRFRRKTEFPLTVFDGKNVVSNWKTILESTSVVHSTIQLAEIGKSCCTHPHHQVFVFVSTIRKVSRVKVIDWFVPVWRRSCSSKSLSTDKDKHTRTHTYL